MKISVLIRFLSILLVLISSAALLPATGISQELKVTRIDGDIAVDGRLDEVEWRDSHSISGFTQFEPEYNAPELFGTTVRVLQNGKMLYFAFECIDPEPDKITAKKTRRDDNLPEDDGVVVFLDTFHDNTTAYFFAVNPIGTQSDGIFTDNGKTVDVNWDTSWESACRITPDGWTAEIGIPFSVLKFDSKTDTWGFNAERRTARTRERSFWIGGLTKMFMVAQFGTMTGLDLSNLSSKRYTIIPYAQIEVDKDGNTEQNAGVDMRYNIVSNLGIEATINPDFATIEGDVEQVNLTRFELSYPEKRPFFLEGAENYRTKIKQFYSRRIGEIPWGIKINGKSGKWKLNSLVTQSDPATAGTDVTEGYDAVYSIFRVNRETSGGSSIGIIGANRTYNDNNSGSVGLVSTLFFTEKFGLTSQVIKSHGEAKDGTWTYFFRPSYDSQFSHFHVRYTDVGEGIMENMNPVGFVRDDDRREFDTNVGRTIWLNAHGIESIDGSINYNRYWSRQGKLRSWKDKNSFEMKFLKNWEYGINYTEEMIRFEKEFRNHDISNALEYNNRKGTVLSVDHTSGVNFDRDFDKLSGSIDTKILKGWDLTYSFSRYWFRPADEGDKNVIHYVRSTYFIHKDMYFKLFYQTKHSYDRRIFDRDFDLQRKTFQLVYVWRIIPPFGSLQLAYQEGSTHHTDTNDKARTLFSKLSWIF